MDHDQYLATLNDNSFQRLAYWKSFILQKDKVPCNKSKASEETIFGLWFISKNLDILQNLVKFEKLFCGPLCVDREYSINHEQHELYDDVELVRRVQLVLSLKKN